MANIRDTQSGKMYAGHSPPTKERISRPSSKVSARSKDVKLMRLDLRNGTTREKFWEMISQSHGGYLTLNTGESHRDENASIHQLAAEGCTMTGLYTRIRKEFWGETEIQGIRFSVN